MEIQKMKNLLRNETTQQYIWDWNKLGWNKSLMT